MLDTNLKDARTARIERRKIQTEADAELAEVYGGEGDQRMHFRSKWYSAGVWPFRRISFECPGCSRWLAVSSSHSGRVGFCPSCDLTLSAPDVRADLPPALVSSSKEIPALPARHLPQPTAEQQAAVTTSSRTVHAPEMKRFGAVEEEGDWGIRDDQKPVPVRVVTRFQNVTPWLGIAALLVCAGMVGKVFMSAHSTAPPGEIPTGPASQKAYKVPLSSELWVVLDSLSTAETPEELASLVRKSDEMLPKMQSFYAQHPEIELPHHFERARKGLKAYDLGGTKFARFEGRCDGLPVKFSFEATRYGWRLDWESLVGYSEGNWEQFIAEKPPGKHQFRVLAQVARDDLIKFDRERYLCLRLSDHLETAVGFALVNRYGDTATKLGKFLRLAERGGSPRTWITPVLSPMEGSQQLLEMVDLKSGSWLIP